ncbi:MAG: hypothetical protein Q8N70_08425, partial [Deltaproteobacteria bacterium]|nr:hypothetical protein [Deltaproteobacteria bacterium]
IVIKYFFFSVSLDRIFFQILNHFPERLVFTELVFDPDLETLYVCFNHLRKLTYLYQKLEIIAIHKILWRSSLIKNYCVFILLRDVEKWFSIFEH